MARPLVLTLSTLVYHVYMTNTQRLTVRASEIRQRLNEIAGLEGDALTDEIRQESETLTTEYRDVETKLRASIAADPDPETRVAAPVDSEERERRELRSRVKLADYVGAAVTAGDAGSAGGAAAELSAAEGCPGLVPLTMWGGTAEQRAAEWRERQERAEHRAVTPAPVDASLPHMHAPIVPAIFDRSIAAFLGCEMPTAPTGIQSFPVLTTSLTAGMVAEDADGAQTAAGWTVTDADPRRLSGGFLVRKEDTAKLPDMEPSLRENLSMVLSDELDKQIANGDNVAPNLNGIFAQLTNPSAPANNAETYARYQAALSSHLDGLYAVGPTDVRALVGVETMRHMLGVYRADEDATTAYDMASTRYGGVRATRRIAAPASNVQQAIIRRMNPAGDRVAAAPTWMGVEIIRDPFTKARAGQIQITGTILVGGVVLLRPAAFVQDSFRLA